MYVKTLLDEVLELQSDLISQATQDPGPIDFDYQLTRRKLMNLPDVQKRLPDFVRRCHTPAHFWSFIKNEYSTYADRRRFIWDSFSDLINYLEASEAGSPIITENIKKTFSGNQASHSFIKEQNAKCLEKLNKSDFDGAITNARSMVEAVFEEVLRKCDVTDIKDDGDLVKLYKQVKDALNLNPGQPDLSQTLQQTLSGLNSIVVGLSGVSNKMGDRHKRKYKPEKHHADLVVNTAFALCEFIVSSLEYQNKR